MSWSILVIDDDDDARFVVSRLLEARGYQVRTAHDGRQALEMMRGAYRPSLVVTDLRMPGLDGAGLIDLLAAERQLRRIPVIVISATPAPERPPLERAAAVLTKPIVIPELLDAVRRVLAGERGEPFPRELVSRARSTANGGDES